MNPKQFWIDQHTALPVALTAEDCAGKVYIVTGSNAGIGREAVKHLVRVGAARVVMGVRSVEKGEAARAAIASELAGKGKSETVVEVWHLDMAEFESIKVFAARAARELPRLDALVLNAMAALDSFTTVDNKGGLLETSIAVNVVGTVLLLLLALPQLRRTGEEFRGSAPHAVVVTSDLGLERPELPGVILEGDDVLDRLSRKDCPSSPITERYPVSKSLQILAVRQLARHVLPIQKDKPGQVVINLLHPGLCNTGMARHSVRPLFRLSVWMLNMVMGGRTPEEGSRTILHAMVAGEGSHGCYLSKCQNTDYYVPDWVTNATGQRAQETLWTQLAARLEVIEPGLLARARGL